VGPAYRRRHRPGGQLGRDLVDQGAELCFHAVPHGVLNTSD
jgi:hypothetical protein